MKTTTPRGVDPAVAKARAVVGLYGDPTVTWSIALDVGLTADLDLDVLAGRCAALVRDRPHLGLRPTPVSEIALGSLLDTPYGDQDPLVRVALSRDGLRLVAAAHHGAVDGLGLLAIVAILLDEEVVSNAHGIGDRRSRTGFVKSSLSRLVAAMFTPPTRLAMDGGKAASDPTPGDVTARSDLASTSADTARVVTAASQSLTAWNRTHGAGSRRLVVAIGASRRDGSDARPDRDTAYLRVPLPRSLAAAEIRQALGAASPEPTFPERPPGRAATLVTRSLRNRLGSSLLVSNLGLVSAPPRVSRIAFYPAAAGPQALAVGVASTSSYTTLTVRMPRANFSEQAAADLCTAIAARLGIEPSGGIVGS